MKAAPAVSPLGPASSWAGRENFSSVSLWLSVSQPLRRGGHRARPC